MFAVVAKFKPEIPICTEERVDEDATADATVGNWLVADESGSTLDAALDDMPTRELAVDITDETQHEVTG